MNIRDIKARTAGLDRTPGRPTVETGKPASELTVKAAAATTLRDQVELSHPPAPSTVSESEQRMREVQFAQKAMKSIPPLTEERVRELQQRIKERYYLQSSVTRRISERLIGELGDEPKE